MGHTFYFPSGLGSLRKEDLCPSQFTVVNCTGLMVRTQGLLDVGLRSAGNSRCSWVWTIPISTAASAQTCETGLSRL
jgi:hypothetical protein